MRTKRFGFVEFCILGLGALFFAHSIYSLFQSNKPSENRGLAQTSSETAEQVADSERTPASTRALEKIEILDVSQFETSKLRFETVAPGVRFTSRKPYTKVVLQAARVTNQTTKFTATLLSEDEEGIGFTTDLMPLKEGLNRIEFLFSSKKKPASPHLVEVFRNTRQSN